MSKSKLRKAIELLELYEWFYGYCSACQRGDYDGHAADCDWVEAIAILKELAKEGEAK